MKIKILTSEELKKIKHDFSSNLKEIIGDFNEYLEKSSEVKMNYSNISLQFEEGTTLGFPCLNRIHFDTIRDFMYQFYKNSRYSGFLKELKYHNLFNVDIHFLNPQFTPFGAFLRQYLQKLTETEVNDIKEVLPFEYDGDLFNKCWTALVPWISNNPIRVRIYYLIYGVNIKGNKFIFDKNRMLKFKIPTKEEKITLVEEMNVEYFFFEGQFKAINRVQSIAQCTSWIEGTTEFTIEQLKEPFMDLDIIHPLYIEEAFHMLGFSDVYVGFITINNPFYPKKITIQPPLEGSKGLVLANPIFQYPEWMQLFFFPPKNTLALDQVSRDFLSFYPEFRKSLTKDSIIKLSVFRLRRALKSRLIMDIILETAIGIETVLVEGTGDLSLQFRLNTSWLLARDYQDREIIEKFCNSLYNMRCKIVHAGGKTKDIEKIANKFGGIHETAELARKMYRLILLKTVSIIGKKIEFIGRTEILKRVKIARLGGELGIEENDIYKRTYKEFIAKLKEKIAI